MAIDDNHRSRENVLARVRAALAGGDRSRPRATPRLHTSPRTRRDRVRRPPTISSTRFSLARPTWKAPSSASLTLDDVAGAVARYVSTLPTACPDPTQDPRAGVCWPELGWLEWKAAGLTIESRPTVGHDALGITGCFCAIAETGTLVFVTGAETPAGTFLLPETHVAIVRADQIVPGMEEAFARVRSERATMPRAINFVSGPSRTGDIEQTIVLGAHGPTAPAHRARRLNLFQNGLHGPIALAFPRSPLTVPLCTISGLAAGLRALGPFAGILKQVWYRVSRRTRAGSFRPRCDRRGTRRRTSDRSACRAAPSGTRCLRRAAMRACRALATPARRIRRPPRRSRATSGMSSPCRPFG